MPALESLDLYKTRITDDGLLALAALAPLRKLKVGMTYITDEGVAGFRTRRPDVDLDDQNEFH